MKCALCAAAKFELVESRGTRRVAKCPEAVTVLAGWAVCEQCRIWLMSFYGLLLDGGKQATSVIGDRIVRISRGGWSVE